MVFGLVKTNKPYSGKSVVQKSKTNYGVEANMATPSAFKT